MQRGPVCLAESERVRFFIAGELGRVGERGCSGFRRGWKWGLLFCELEDDRSVRMEKAGLGVKKSSKGGGQFWFFLPREGSRFGLSLAKRGCWPRGERDDQGRRWSGLVSVWIRGGERRLLPGEGEEEFSLF